MRSQSSSYDWIGKSLSPSLQSKKRKTLTRINVDNSKQMSKSKTSLPVALPPNKIGWRSDHRCFRLVVSSKTRSTSQILTLSENLADDFLCAGADESSLPNYSQPELDGGQLQQPSTAGNCIGSLCGESRIERAWAHWRKLGEPKLIVAPMVDQSELPFRLLCRKYGADAAYTPMLQSHIFVQSNKYRTREFTTCKEDRPLFVQFGGNDPDTLLEAAKRVEACCDYIDINLGCPQHFARQSNYGAFLMDDLPLVKSLVEKLSLNLTTPVSCKIRVFPELQDTLNYAKMLQDSGCSLLAVHGRTRDEKNGKKIRANWDIIKAVKEFVGIPVLANGNIRHMDDVNRCLKETGADGVLSAESLLQNPALFAGYRTDEWVFADRDSGESGTLDQVDLMVEYLKLCEEHPVPWRMIRSHVYKMLGEWFRNHPEVREEFNNKSILTFDFLYGVANRLRELGVKKPLYMKDPSRVPADLIVR